MGFVPSELLFNALLDLREDSRKPGRLASIVGPGGEVGRRAMNVPLGSFLLKISHGG